MVDIECKYVNSQPPPPLTRTRRQHFRNDFPVLPPTHVTPCHPDPCGDNARCTASGTVAYCTCLPGFFGDARVQCRPECLVSSDCPLTLSCISQKCRDPCPGTCGNNALCSVVSHNPVCACPEGYTGDPFTDCRVRPPPRKAASLSPPTHPLPPLTLRPPSLLYPPSPGPSSPPALVPCFCDV